MIIRSKAPLRLGLAGGGTDVSPYSDIFGGAILNATISLYAYATIKPTSDGKIRIHAIDRNEKIDNNLLSKVSSAVKCEIETLENKTVSESCQK